MLCPLRWGGGHGCGDVASQVVVAYRLQRFREAPGGSVETVAMLLDAANEAVVMEQRRVAEQSDMRATVALLILDLVNATAIWGHVGDSRVYAFRNGTICNQTRDHSVVQSDGRCRSSRAGERAHEPET